MKQEDRTTLKEIARRIKDRRAPPCPYCASGGSIAGGQVGLVTCNTCGGQWSSLKACWKDAVKRSVKEEGRHWWRAPRDQKAEEPRWIKVEDEDGGDLGAVLDTSGV